MTGLTDLYPRPGAARRLLTDLAKLDLSKSWSVGDWDAAGQANRYAVHVTASDWAGLRSKADSDLRESQSIFTALQRAQKSIDGLLVRIADVDEHASPKPTSMDSTPDWPGLKADLEQALAARGDSPARVRAALAEVAAVDLNPYTALGPARISLVARGRYLNNVFRLVLRRYAGALLALICANLNDDAPRWPRTVPTGRSSSDVVQLERDVFDALTNATDLADAVAAAGRLRGGGEAGLRHELEALRDAAASTRNALLATAALEASVEAVCLGRLLEWRFAWHSSRLVGSVGRGSPDLPFDDPADHPTLAAHSDRPVAVEGVVRTVSFVAPRTSFAVKPRTGRVQEFVAPVDLTAFGLADGEFVRVDGYRDSGPRRVVSTVPIGNRSLSWRGAVREVLRASVLMRPEGLGMQWSWPSGSHGVSALVTDAAWCS